MLPWKYSENTKIKTAPSIDKACILIRILVLVSSYKELRIAGRNHFVYDRMNSATFHF